MSVFPGLGRLHSVIVLRRIPRGGLTVALYNPCSRLIWSLTSAGPSTTLATAGNSGTWAGNPSQETPVDLRDVTDVWLSAYVGGTVTGGAPSLVASLNVYDS